MQPDHKHRHRRPIRPTLLDIIARAETDTGSDEIDILVLLRTLVTAVETPADRLFARYHGRPSAHSLVYAEYHD
jgi:hypothetical protein